MPFSPNAETIYADGAVGTPQQPYKPDIRAYLKQVEAATDAIAAGSGTIAKQTQTQLNADLAHAADTMAWVYADANVAANGIYRKNGASGAGSWSPVLPLPYTYIVASNAGTGTANAIKATSSVPVTNGMLVSVPISVTNTDSPVTIAFNSQSPLTIKTRSGQDVAQGDLTPGYLLGARLGAIFYLLSDTAVASLIYEARDAAFAARERAEEWAENPEDSSIEPGRFSALHWASKSHDDADRSEAAKDIAAGFASDVVSQGNVPIYATVLGMPAISVKAGINAVRVNGYATAGDGGGALYRQVDSEPTHPGKFRSQDGEWWEFAEAAIAPQHAGAKGDYDATLKAGTDDTSTIMAAVAVASVLGIPLQIGRNHLVSFHDYGTIDGLARNTDGNRYTLFLKNLVNITIIGTGGGLYFSGTDRSNYAQLIYAETCGKVSISGDLTLDWVNIPFLQGTVTEITADYIEFIADWPATFTDVQRVNLWDPASRLMIQTIRDRPAGSYDVGSALAFVSGLTYRISRASGVWNVANVAVGSLITADHQIYGFGPINTHRCDEVYIGPGVKVRHGAGMACWLRSGRIANVQGLTVDVRPGGRELLTTDADGIHVSGFAQRFIAQNEVRRTGDDCINSNDQNTIVTAQADGTHLSVQYTFPYVLPYSGDRIKFYNINSGEVRYANLIGVTPPDNAPSMSTGSSGSFAIVLDASIGTVSDGTWAVVFASDNTIEQISENTVGWNRGRGILSSTVSVMILKNRIEKTGMAIFCETYGAEFGKATTIMIEGNVAVDVNNSPFDTPSPAAIWVHGSVTGSGTLTRSLGTVIATKNVVVRSGNAGVQIEGAKAAYITDNDFYDIALRSFPFPYSLGTDPLAAAFVDCGDAYAGGNRNLGSSPLYLKMVNVDVPRLGDNEHIINPFSGSYVGGGYNSLRKLSVTGSVNFWQAQGNLTGFGPILAAVGADANINAVIAAKGVGSGQLSSNGKPALEGYNANSTAVNWIRANGQISGFGVLLEAIGADTNIDIATKGKGTGKSSLADGAGANKVSVNTTGIGFYGVAPIAKPTVAGSKGSNAALGSLITAMANLGLITDTSS